MSQNNGLSLAVWKINKYLNIGAYVLSVAVIFPSQPLFSAICPALTEEDFWTTNRQQYNFTSLQLFISDAGVALFYPAIAQGMGACDQLDARVNQVSSEPM